MQNDQSIAEAAAAHRFQRAVASARTGMEFINFAWKMSFVAAVFVALTGVYRGVVYNDFVVVMSVWALQIVVSGVTLMGVNCVLRLLLEEILRRHSRFSLGVDIQFYD